MNRKTNAILGTIFVVLGALFLLDNLGIVNPFRYIFSIGNLWPLFVLLPGLIFHYAFFAGNRKDPGLLVPGGILLVLGTTFLISTFFHAWHITWPLYIFAVAFGLYELYLFGGREKGLLIPVGILGGLSVIFFMTFSINELFGYSTRKFLTPLVLIVIGLAVLFGGTRKKEY